MATNINPEQYKNIINVTNYKISIARDIKSCIDCMDYNKTWMNIDELYNCHKIIFKNNKFFLQLNEIGVYDIRQEFTIHHFIYYIKNKMVKRSKINPTNFIFANFNTFKQLMDNVKQAYKIHFDTLINNIYDYLYPTANLQILSNIFLIFKNTIETFSDGIFMTSINIKYYCNFTTWTEYDLLYNLMDYIEMPIDNDYSIISLVYNELIDNSNNKYKKKDVINLIQTYKQTRTEERLKIYKEELVMKTWHPDRLIDWCLDIEEKMDHIE